MPLRSIRATLEHGWSSRSDSASCSRFSRPRSSGLRLLGLETVLHAEEARRMAWPEEPWGRAPDLAFRRFGGVAGNHGVVKTVVRESGMGVDAGVTQGSVFVAAEGEHGSVHLFGVEHPEVHE